MSQIFHRLPKNPQQYIQVRERLSQIFRADNLERWNQRRIYESFRADESDSFRCYAFEVLATWRQRHEGYTAAYLKGMDFIIKMLNIQRFLSTTEQNYIRQYQEVVFAQKRNLKNLIVDFPIQPQEAIWYRYHLDWITQNGHELFQDGMIYLGNQRIVLVKDHFYTTFILSEVTKWKLRHGFLQITTLNGVLLLSSEQILAIYVSFERIMRVLKLFIK